MAEVVVKNPPDSRIITARIISWGAVFAGIVVAVMVSLILGCLGMVFGLDAGQSGTASKGTLAWWTASSVVALFAGGCAAGRLAGVLAGVDTMLHGVVTWGATTLLALLAIGTTAGGLLRNSGNLLAGGLAATEWGIGDSRQIDEPAGARTKGNKTLAAVKDEARAMLRSARQTAGQPLPQSPWPAEQILMGALDRLSVQPRGSDAQANRLTVIEVLQAQVTKSFGEAEGIVDGWIVRLDSARIESEPAGTGRLEAGESFMGRNAAAAWGLLALLLGGAAAALGGRVGRPGW